MIPSVPSVWYPAVFAVMTPFGDFTRICFVVAELTFTTAAPCFMTSFMVIVSPICGSVFSVAIIPPVSAR